MRNQSENCQNHPISVITGADDKFAIGLAVTLFSALANLASGSAIDFYVIDGGISEANKQKLAQVLQRDSVAVRLRWLKPDLKALGALQVSNRWGVATFFRILAPELLPPDLDRVIYLDSDLVIEGNLAELWQTELEDCPVLAVQDYWLPQVSLPCALAETYHQLGLKPDVPFFNAGMLVLNLKQWRTQNLAQTALDYAHRYQTSDQEAINAAIAGQGKPLDLRWNVQMCGIVRPAMKLPYDAQELIRQAFIIHYTSPDKPWQPFYKLYGGSRFAHYLQRSHWFDRWQYLQWFITTRILQIIVFPLALTKRYLQQILFPGLKPNPQLHPFSV